MQRNKALFLDRDGVINADCGYVHRPEEFEFLDGIFDLCKAAQALDYLLLVVTNQAGIARGYYTEEDFLRITAWMINEFRQRNVTIAKVYYCPYHVDGKGVYRRDSSDRKPNPGMFLRAIEEFELAPEASALIGDQLSDIYAAEAAGIGTRIWLGGKTGCIPDIAPGLYMEQNVNDVRNRFFATVATGSAI